ncbi:hypothetical protein [Massilia sp. CCM 8734]|uniref:hypothetical protein n=1 Tax=Massilia sp. CCM 8734 TaxID=2609283 RepID=UPI00141E025E|nr:hypothetical protein [Massilia sp. CCM 8734]NIA00661.1 hypothetical protein [Massilia sp. CCM 8734]
MTPLLDDNVTRELVAMKMANAKPSCMLHHIRLILADDAADWVIFMKYFRHAFDLSIKQVSPILGWHMGELDDSQLDNFLLAEIYPS